MKVKGYCMTCRAYRIQTYLGKVPIKGKNKDREIESAKCDTCGRITYKLDEYKEVDNGKDN